jgi:hypothetical protein
MHMQDLMAWGRAWSRCVELMHMQDLMMHSHISRTE